MKGSALDTPMMRQYLSIKSQYPDAVVFYRMGDFYEMFLEDAELAAPLLDIALTTRDKGKIDPVPMCGVPVHSADPHIKRLAELGHRVAICEQVENPKDVGGRRLVRRDVVEVVTPGMVGDPSNLESLREVAVSAVCRGQAGTWGLSTLDASTGDFRTTEAQAAGDGAPLLLLEELERIAPREILLSAEDRERLGAELAVHLPDASLRTIEPERFDPAQAPACPDGFDPAALDPATRVAAALLSYLAENQPFSLVSVPRLRHYELAETMVLDSATCAHLELFENAEDRGRRGTLIDQLDRTCTPLGARRLARWMRYPLLDPAAVAARHDAVAWLAERDRPRQRLREALAGVRDLERILAKAIRPTSVPRDLGILRSSLEALPRVAEALHADTEELLDTAAARLPELAELPVPEPQSELASLLAQGLVDDPPVVPRGSRGANETGYIRTGFRPELDALRESASKGREWIAGLEAQEREQTGIATLKIRFHPVHGYSLEVTKTQLGRVPESYERKQTLANVERFTTKELRAIEADVLGSAERAAALEREILESLRQAAVARAAAVRASADAVARLDALATLAEVARREGWVRPEVDAGDDISIRGGRHPVVEAVLARRGGDGFVPNDTELDPSDTQILLLTGPNMSGKSTYLRQVALIVLLAQMGSFVPAEFARIGAVDRIFTRVGASDRLARGESTFMVEMRETSQILSQASRHSLVILDEIGRGTSTFDGLSIAWAVAEYLHDTPGLHPRTLFATHYHELSDLARTKPRVRNAHFEAREWKDEVVFLRRLVPGSANRSYGIQVARLAGLPDVVISRARQILKNLEQGELDGAGAPRLARAEIEADAPGGQLALSLGPQQVAAGIERTLSAGPEREVLAELRAADPDTTTPVDALLLLQRLVERLREGDAK